MIVWFRKRISHTPYTIQGQAAVSLILTINNIPNPHTLMVGQISIFPDHNFFTRATAIAID